MFHPWRALRDLAHVTVVWHDGGPAGLTFFETATISLRRGMTQAQRRSTLCHEIVHLERGPTVSTLVGREERRVCDVASRRLVGIRELGEALAWAHHLQEAADELWVDVGTLRDRLDHLHPSERAYLYRRLSHRRDNDGMPHVGQTD